MSLPCVANHKHNLLSIILEFLFNRSKGHGSGCTTAPQRNAPLSLLRVLSNTAHHTKPAQLYGGTDTKMPASKTKGKCAGNTPNTFILANRRRSNF